MNSSNNILHLFSLSIIAVTIFLSTSSLGAEVNETEKKESHSSEWGFGFHGGINISDFSYTNKTTSYTKKSSTGALLGIHIEGMSLGIFGVRVEANYSVKGYDLYQFATVSHRYLQIPLLFKISPIVGPIEFFVEAGPAASFHLSSSVEFLNTSFTYNDNADTWDFSIIGGLGIGFKIDPVLLEFEARYDYGLKNLSKSSTIEINSRAVQLIAGITFLM